MNHFSAAAKKKIVSDFLNKGMFMYLYIFMVPVSYRLQLNPRVCAVLAAWLFIYLDFSPYLDALWTHTCVTICVIFLYFVVPIIVIGT